MYSFKTISPQKHRKDIDGIRAIAVLSVFIFHAGYLPNGFLGVDIFFVISGYLITRILYLGILNDTFSMSDFYIRRIRRIIPLVLFFSLLSLLIGLVVMLPADLENLAQSIVATNLFANNFLLCFTNGDYWDVLNEYKPLMHTWSLGIEEQFYFLYPIIFLLFRNKPKAILPIIITFSIVSLGFYLYQEDPYRFYLLPSRFFELAIGGIAAIVFKHTQFFIRGKWVLLVLLIAMLFINLHPQYVSFQIPIICILSTLLLITYDENGIADYMLQTKMMVELGKISFSFYMWHQVLLAYTRYFIVQEITEITAIVLFIITTALSYLTYWYIENPFRNKNKFSDRSIIIGVASIALLSICTSLTIHLRTGIIRDVPELDLTKEDFGKEKHLDYLTRAYDFPKDFSGNSKIKVIVWGNSFARDWINILKESHLDESIEIVLSEEKEEMLQKAEEADIIFFARLANSKVKDLSISEISELDSSIQGKIWCVGTKNFGVSNGIFYNSRNKDYCNQRTNMESGYYEENERLKSEWKDRYIDLVAVLVDKENKMPVFTPDCKFFSQDTRHLTSFGAHHIASRLKDRLTFIFDSIK